MIRTFRAWRRQHAIDRIEVSETQWTAVEATLPPLGHLGASDRGRLRAMARAFIAEKEWTGAGDLRLTPAIQLSIALQACLPILNLGLDHYRGWVGIVVYPGDFIIPRSVMDDDGVVHEYDDLVLGEAWEGGPVLISWFDDAADADGANVVIHEFAHKLDMENGAVDGIPRLHDDMSLNLWIDVFASALADFQRRVDAGEVTPLDPYAAEDPAEFFAVMSEAFFQAPGQLRRDYPAVYEQLARFYRQNPLA